MKPLFVFLFGRPGSGKSELYKRTVALLKKNKIGKEYIRIDDFPKLEEKWQNELKANEFKRFRPTEDGSFIVTDEKLYDELLDEINLELLKLKKPDRVIFVEFARSNYMQALSHFSNEILNNAIGVYLDVSFENCWKRNVERIKELKKKGLDAHFVPKERMQKSYENDDKDELIKNSSIPIVYIDNDVPKGFKKLIPGCKKLLNKIKSYYGYI